MLLLLVVLVFVGARLMVRLIRVLWRASPLNIHVAFAYICAAIAATCGLRMVFVPEHAVTYGLQMAFFDGWTIWECVVIDALSTELPKAKVVP
jgi:hypothetical protein